MLANSRTSRSMRSASHDSPWVSERLELHFDPWGSGRIELQKQPAGRLDEAAGTRVANVQSRFAVCPVEHGFGGERAVLTHAGYERLAITVVPPFASRSQKS
jgi:hypothetical protein